MKLDYNQIQTVEMPNFKGGEKSVLAQMFNDEKNRIMRLTLVPGASIGLHTHTTSSEIIYVLSGCGTAICEGTEEKLTPGCAHYCSKGQTHTLINDGEEPLHVFAVVPEQ
ncbi:MAG: cupin domain-containing protein [Paludibacteraceae bacterium]|nr:cupin domain-containing protein [Paludibacteraceae bacterium]